MIRQVWQLPDQPGAWGSAPPLPLSSPCLAGLPGQRGPQQGGPRESRARAPRPEPRRPGTAPGETSSRATQQRAPQQRPRLPDQPSEAAWRKEPSGEERERERKVMVSGEATRRPPRSPFSRSLLDPGAQTRPDAPPREFSSQTGRVFLFSSLDRFPIFCHLGLK